MCCHSVSKRVVEMHEGKLSVTSEGVGHGCTFTLLLPVSTVAQTELSIMSRVSSSVRSAAHRAVHNYSPSFRSGRVASIRANNGSRYISNRRQRNVHGNISIPRIADSQASRASIENRYVTIEEVLTTI